MAKRVVTRKRGETAAAPPPSRLRTALAPVTDFVVRHRIRLGATAALLLGAVIVYETVTPAIKELPPDPAAPLTFSFAVRTGWLPISNLRGSCAVRNLTMRVVTPNVRVAAPDFTRTDSRTYELAEHTTKVFNCPIDTPGPFARGTAVAKVEYDMLSIPRALEETFSWLGEVGKPRWVKGDLYRPGS
jgi:hypothetical protein